MKAIHNFYENQKYFINSIYNKEFSYSLPQTELEKYFSGKAFDRKTEYTPEDKRRINKDMATISAKAFDENIFEQILRWGERAFGKSPVVVLTAGAPGAGKTTLMEKELAKISQRVVYLDPDAVCLKTMHKSHGFDVIKDPSKEGRLEAYNAWRPASNGIAHLLLGIAIRDKFDIFFGTTSTGPFTWKSFEGFKKEGYKIEVLHISAEDGVRFGSIKKRDESFIQSTLEDTTEKGKLLPQRINDTYLKYADRIQFFWRDGVNEEAKLAATWTRNERGGDKLGTLTIIDQEGYFKIKQTHNRVAEELKKADLIWEKAVEARSTIHKVS